MIKQTPILKLILSLIFLIYSASVWSCSCVEATSIKTAVKYADYVVSGEILDSQIVRIWSDTSDAKNWFTALHQGDSITDYNQWKNNSVLFSLQLVEYRLLVETIYKGNIKSDTITIRTGFGRGDCGFQFHIGENYLVYGKYEKNVKYTLEKLGRSKKELREIFRTNICYRTQLKSRAQSDLEYLNK